VRIAKAQVHNGGPSYAFERPVDTIDRKFIGLADERLHERLIQLDDVGACPLVIVDLLVHHLRVGHQQRALVAIELVLGEPHRRERTGHRDLDRFAGQGPQDFDIAHLHRVCAADFPDHARHDLARAVTPLHFRWIVDVDASERVGETVESSSRAEFRRR